MSPQRLIVLVIAFGLCTGLFLTAMSHARLPFDVSIRQVAGGAASPSGALFERQHRIRPGTEQDNMVIMKKAFGSTLVIEVTTLTVRTKDKGERIGTVHDVYVAHWLILCLYAGTVLIKV